MTQSSNYLIKNSHGGFWNGHKWATKDHAKVYSDHERDMVQLPPKGVWVTPVKELSPRYLVTIKRQPRAIHRQPIFYALYYQRKPTVPKQLYGLYTTTLSSDVTDAIAELHEFYHFPQRYKLHGRDLATALFNGTDPSTVTESISHGDSTLYFVGLDEYTFRQMVSP